MSTAHKLEPDINQALVDYKLAEIQAWLADLPPNAISDLEGTSHQHYGAEMDRLLTHFERVLAKALEVIK